jgi:hypothetical protein
MRARMIHLSTEMSVSESTLYKWREDILEIVLYAAMETGVVGLFGIRETEKPQDKKTDEARRATDAEVEER